MTEVFEFVMRRFGWIDWKIEKGSNRDTITCYLPKNVCIELHPLTIFDGSHRISVSIHDKTSGQCGPLESFDEVENWIVRALDKIGANQESYQMTIFSFIDGDHL